MKLDSYHNDSRTGPWKKLDLSSAQDDRSSFQKLKILFKWVYPVVRPYRKKAIGSWLILMCISAVSVTPIFLSKKIVQGFEKSDSNLYLYLILMALVILTLGILKLFSTVSLASIQFRVRHDLEEKYVSQLSSMPLSYYESNASGNISIAAFNQIPLLSGFIDIIFKNFIQSGTTIIGVIVTMFISDTLIGFFTLVLMPFFFIGVKYSGRATERSVQSTFSRISDLHSFILESFISVKTIRTLGISRNRLEGIKDIVDQTLKEEKKTLLLTELTHFCIEVVFAVGIICLIFILHSRFISGMLSLPLCAAAAAGFIVLAKEVRSLTRGILSIRNMIGATSHLSESIAHPADMALEGNYQGAEKIREISVENLGFCYSAKKPVLHNINMTFQSSEITGIIGSSGAGKSTLVDLLLRLRMPSSGSIKIDNRPITDFSEQWLRKKISFVDQEPFLFDTTIRDNLTLAEPDLTDQEIEEVLEAASAKEFVAQLENGLDSYVGEGGCLISVGQKQRLALARALIGDPLVVILDEITSAIDPENEKIIIQALLKLAQDKIVILISHKQSVIDCCDRIYSLDQGISHLIR